MSEKWSTILSQLSHLGPRKKWDKIQGFSGFRGSRNSPLLDRVLMDASGGNEKICVESLISFRNLLKKIKIKSLLSQCLSDLGKVCDLRIWWDKSETTIITQGLCSGRIMLGRIMLWKGLWAISVLVLEDIRPAALGVRFSHFSIYHWYIEN